MAYTLADCQEFKEIALSMGLPVTDEKINQLLKYYEMLVEKNKVMNLTGITEFSEVFRKHFLDSLLPFSDEKLCEKILLDLPLTVCDMGTGAGFPGMVLKILFPNWQIILVDSLNKRLKFLQEVIDELGLTGIETCHMRAEDFGRDKNFRDSFDLCVSRAVANYSTLSEYCLPTVRPGGHFLSYKTDNAREEILAGKGAVKKLGGGELQIFDVFLPVFAKGIDASSSGNDKVSTDEINSETLSPELRVFALVKKEKNTPKAYPRKAGLPGKEPLG